MKKDYVKKPKKVNVNTNNVKPPKPYKTTGAYLIDDPRTRK